MLWLVNGQITLESSDGACLQGSDFTSTRKRQQQQAVDQLKAAEAAAAAKGVNLLDDPQAPAALQVGKW